MDDDEISIKIENKDLTDSDGTIIKLESRLCINLIFFIDESKENREKHTEIQEQ